MHRSTRLTLWIVLALFAALPLPAQFLTFRDINTTSFPGPVQIGLAAAPDGTIYYCSSVAHVIGRIDPLTGAATVISGTPGVYGAVDGPIDHAMYSAPNGLAVDASGNIFVADTLNHKIRKISSTGWVTTLAGSGGCGYVNGNGSAAQFCGPKALALDAGGNVWVADSSNNSIRKVAPNGDVTTVAGAQTTGSADGTGSAARFNFPSGIAFNGSDAFYVSDQSNSTIRKVTLAGAVTTLAGVAGSAGNLDGTGSGARFYIPSNVSVASDTGDIFVADYFNDAVRRVSPAGVVTTPGGIVRGPGSDEGTGYQAQFNHARCVAAIDAYTLFVSDNNGVIKLGTRSIPDQAVIDVASGNVGQSRHLSDAPVTATQFNWTVEKRPAKSTAALSDPSIVTPIFTPDIEGSYTFRLDAALPGSGTSITRVNAGATCPTPPAAPVITRLSGNEPSCPAEQIVLQASAGFDSYSWESGSTVLGTGTTLSVQPTFSTSYFLKGMVNGCSSAYTSYNHVVISQPGSPSMTYTGQNQTCRTGTAGRFSLLTSYGTGYALQWGYRTVSGGTVTNIAGQTASQYVLNGGDFPAAGTYYLVCTITPTCGFASSVSKEQWVTIVDPMVMTTTASATDACPGKPVTLTATLSGRQYYGGIGTWWFYTNGNIAAYCNGTSTCTATVYAGSSCYAVSNDSTCRVQSQTITIATDPVPTPGIFWGPTCDGVQASVMSPNPTSTYVWSNGATGPNMIPAVSGYYSVTETNAFGCSATSYQSYITQTFPSKPVITASGPTTFCAGGSVTLTANSGFTTYLWSNGATTPSIVVPAAGNYSVTTTDSRGCIKTSTPVTVVVNAIPPTPAITPSGPTTFCAGGSVTLTAPAGYSYLWSNGATTQSIATGAPGSYRVTVTDPNGCSAISVPTVVGVNANPTPVITPSGPTTFCAGGSLTLSAPSGMTAYSWSTGATTQSITVTSPGSYSVSVIDPNGCGGTSAPVNVVVNTPATTTITPSGPTTFCAGGSVTLTAPDGNTYVWSTGATTQSILVSTPGSYTVAVTDDNGCSATSDPTVVTANTPPPATISASGPTTFCAGGSVTLTAPAGYSYAWSTGATTQSILVATSGSYTVTVHDVNGCSTTSAPSIVAVNANPATPVVTASGPTTFCAGGSVTLTAPAGANSYLWSTGATTQSIVVSGSGNYSVAVADANGCSAASTPTIVSVNANPATPVVTASGPTTFCAGGSVTLTAPVGYNYLWSNGATTQSITVSTAGSYSVTVTDANGCGATSTPAVVTVNANPATPVITAGGPTTLCAGGSVTLTAPAASSYLWSNGATTQSIVVTSAGSYSVSVTNASGCSASSSPTVVTVNALPAAIITASGSTTFCAGGSVTLTAPAGMSAYSWSSGATTQSITVSASGSYSVTVTDANGCSATSTPAAVTVNANPPAPVITASGPTTFCASGSVTLTAPAGANSYLWSTGATTQSILVTGSGSYSVAVADANGCGAASAPTVVSVNANPATPVVTASGPTMFCSGGSVTLTAPVGYSYLWSNGATTQAITVSTIGSYSVTVTDPNGCSATSSPTVVTVNANAATPIITPSGPLTFCAGGSVTLTASAGSSYLWSNGAIAQSITVSAAGSYSVSVTDPNGCSATSTPTFVTVNANPPTPVVTAGGPITFCAGGSVTLTAPASMSSYNWSNGATTQSISVSASGSYSVTVANAAGCSATSTPTVVTVNANPATPVITAGGPTTFCAGGSLTLTAPAGMSSYNWSTGATTQSIVVSASGSYSVTVANAAGCSATSTPTVVTVNANPATPVVTAGGPTTFCAGGSVTLTAPAGMSSYNWSTGATTQAITVSASGSYTVTVRNASNCAATSAPTVVTVNALPIVGTPSPLTQSVQRNKTTTTITATASGSGTLLYQWFQVSGTTYTAVTSQSPTNSGCKPSSGTRGTFKFILRVTVQSTGCTADSAQATVTIT